MNTVTMSGILVKSTDLPRMPLAEGIDYRMLRTSPETETWTILLRASFRSPYAKHRHLGQGKVFFGQRGMEYRSVSAVVGEYGYKSLNAVNEETNFPQFS